MAGIEQRGQSYRVVWRQDGAKQTERFEDQYEAVAFKNDVERCGGRWPTRTDSRGVAQRWMRGRGYVDETEADAADAAGGETVAQRVSATIDEPGRGGRLAQEQTRRRLHRMMAEHLDSAPLGKTLLRDATESDVRDWLAGLAHYSVAYQTDLLKPVRRAFRRAATAGVVSAGMTLSTVHPITNGTERQRWVWLHDSEIDRIVAELPEKYRLFIRTIYAGGLRLGEARGLLAASPLQMGDNVGLLIHQSLPSNRKDGLAPTKSAASHRTVIVNRAIGVELLALAATRESPSDLLFGYIDDSTVRKMWVRAVKAAGITTSPRIHDLRHSHASWLLARGVSLHAVSKRLGHSSITITANIYGHVQPDDEFLVAVLNS